MAFPARQLSSMHSRGIVRLNQCDHKTCRKHRPTQVRASPLSDADTDKVCGCSHRAGFSLVNLVCCYDYDLGFNRQTPIWRCLCCHGILILFVLKTHSPSNQRTNGHHNSSHTMHVLYHMSARILSLNPSKGHTETDWIPIGKYESPYKHSCCLAVSTAYAEDRGTLFINQSNQPPISSLLIPGWGACITG